MAKDQIGVTEVTSASDVAAGGTDTAVNKRGILTTGVGKAILGIGGAIVLATAVFAGVTYFQNRDKAPAPIEQEEDTDKFDTSKWKSTDLTLESISQSEADTLNVSLLLPSETTVESDDGGPVETKIIKSADFEIFLSQTVESVLESYEGKENVDINSSVFDTVKRVKVTNNFYVYTSSYGNTGCSNANPAPCGYRTISLKNLETVSLNFICETTAENVKFCDLILENLKVSKSEEEKIANDTAPTIPSGWSVEKSANCGVELPLPPASGKYIEKVNDTNFKWFYKESHIADNLYNLFDYQTFVHYAPYDTATNEIYGSGDISGSVLVDCGPLGSLKTLEDAEKVIQNAVKDFNSSDALEGAGIPPLKYTETGSSNVLGITSTKFKVTGGMESINEEYHLIIFKNKVYMITKIPKSNKPVVNETLDIIYKNMRFK